MFRRHQAQHQTRHQTARLSVSVALLIGLHGLHGSSLWAGTGWADDAVPPAVPNAPASPEAITPRAFLPIVANMLPASCTTTQPGVPEPGLWSFVLNFDASNNLQGCLMYAASLTSTRLTIQFFDCFVNDPAHVSFLEEGGRQFARFDGAGYVHCPGFDPPTTGTGVRRERKSLVAVARSAETNTPRQNPLLHHPYSTTVGSKSDVAYDMPVIPGAGTASVGLVSHHLIAINLTKAYTSPTGGTHLGWNVLSSDMRVFGNNFLVLTHTINSQTPQTFPATAILFNFDPMTLTIGFNPETGEYLKGDLDEIILDPKRASAGN
jgi:hypothetical protein